MLYWKRHTDPVALRVRSGYDPGIKVVCPNRVIPDVKWSASGFYRRDDVMGIQVGAVNVAMAGLGHAVRKPDCIFADQEIRRAGGPRPGILDDLIRRRVYP